MKNTKLNVLVVAIILMLTTLATSLVASGDDFDPMANPTITGIYPSDGATNVDHQLNPFTFEENKVVCNVSVEDPDGDSMDVTFATNATGSWTNMQTNSSVGNGTYRWHFTDCDTAGTQYWWRVYVNDSTTNVSETYSFTTAGPADIKIQNSVDNQDFIDVKKGEHLNLTVYVDTNEMWIDTVEPWEITFTHALLEGVDSDGNSSNGNVTWGDLFYETLFEKTGTWHNDVGILNGTVRANGDTNTSGDLMFFHFDTGEGTGTAYVNMTVGEVGVAFTDNDDPNVPRTTVDRPFTVANLSMFIHYYIPTEPSAFTATTVSQTQIDLSWVKDSTGNYGVDPDDGVGEYVYIERNTVSSWSMGDGTEVYNGTGTSFSDTDVVQGTQYWYQAWSYNETDSLYSIANSSDTDTTQSLTPPGDVVVEPYDGIMMNLSWTVADADSDTTYIERSTTPGPWSIGDGDVAYNDTGSSFTDTDLDHNTTYYYQIWAYDADDGIYSDTFSTGSNTTTVLLAPTSFTSSWNDPNQHTQIDLTWTNADGTDTTYIERNTVDTWNRTDGTMIYNDSGTSFTDTGLDQNTHYYYKAWSYNATEGFSATYDSTDNTTDDFVAPTSISVTPDDGVKMDLSWTVTDPDSDYVYVERNTAETWAIGTGTEVCNLSVLTTTFKDDNLDHNTTYYYQFWNYNATENIYSDLYAEGNNTTTVLLAPTGLSVVQNTAKPHTQLDLSWTNADGIDSTYIERYSSETWSIGTGSMIYNGTLESFTDTGLDQNTQYFYQAWSYNVTEGFSPAYDEANTTTKKLLPINFTATAQGNATILLEWNNTSPDTTILEEGFEDGFPPTGWSNHQWEDSSYGDAHTGSHWAFAYDDPYPSDASILTTPSLTFKSDTELTFWYRAENSGYPVILEIEVDSTIVWSNTSITSETYQQATVDLSAYTGSYSITFKGGGNSFYGICLDDIEATTSDEKNNMYIERNTAPTWSRGAGTMVYNGTDNSYLDDDVVLDHSTTYYYQAWMYNISQNIYSDEYSEANETTTDLQAPESLAVIWNSSAEHTIQDISWVNNEADSDATVLEYMEGIPSGEVILNEGFEDGFPPTGWTNYQWENSTYGGVHTGSCWANFYEDGSVLTTPSISIDTNKELTFWYRAEDSNYLSATLEVRIDNSTVIWSDTLDNTTYQQATVDLSAYTGEHNISFVGQTGSFYGGAIDDITIGPLSSWNPGEGTELYNGTDTSFVHSGLTQNTLYRYQAWSWNESEGIYSPLFDSAENTTADLLSPSPFTATVIDWDGITISWTIADTDSDTTYIERNTISSWSIGAGDEIYNDTGTSFDDTGLDSKTQYFYQAWAYNATENIYSTLYSSDNDTTLNTPPVKPTNVYPTDNKPYCSVYTTIKAYLGVQQTETTNLTVYVEDPDGDNLDVDFYWNDDEFIGTVSAVTSGTNAVLNLAGNISADKSPTASAYDWLEHDSTYGWYAIADDSTVNPGDYHTNTSSTWTFNTSNYADINENGVVDYLDVSLLASNYRDSCDPGEEGWDMNNDGISNYIDVSGLVSSYGNEYHTW